MYEELFNLQEEAFKVLANQKRLEIIQLLGSGELSVSQMIDMLDLPQANLSQHLGLLRQAGMVSTRRDGVTIYYTLSDPRVTGICDTIRQLLHDQHRFSPEVQSLLKNQHSFYPVVKDAVCGMRISLSRAGASTTYNGLPYYFCASGCHKKFLAAPAAYIPKGDTRS